jgi:hypothetical protein
MDATKRQVLAAAAVVLVTAVAAFVAAGSGGAGGQAVDRRQAVEITLPANVSDEAVLGRPVALALAADRLYIADALDCAVKAFSKDGRFLGSLGRKGLGPGELSFPSGVAAFDEGVAVADKLNFRIQVFDARGTVCGGFKVPFAPDRVFALGGRKLLVTANPSGRGRGERLLHAFDDGGRQLWDALEADISSDPVLDAFRNMILVCPGEDGDVYVVYRSGRRTILHFSGSGILTGQIAVDERHGFKSLDMPSRRGVVTLTGFCWAAARDRGTFYLSAPEAVDGRDLGPGRTASVVDGQGRLRSVVELPCPVHRFLVADGRMFAIDDEGLLRIFEVGR